ncbi:unnamed protein product [Ascophyllum nodosum]
MLGRIFHGLPTDTAAQLSVEQKLQDVHSNGLLWGRNIVVVMEGDFRQVLLAVQPRTRTQDVESCINQLRLWAGVIVVPLRIDMPVMAAAGSDRDLGGFCNWQIMEIGKRTALAIG